MMDKKKVFRTLGLLFILVIIFYLISNSITKYTGFLISDTDNNFESCLEEKDIILYINSYDAIETLDNFETKDYLMNVKVFNCLLNKYTCINKDINHFPTWDIGGKKIEGDISVEELSSISGCKLN